MPSCLGLYVENNIIKYAKVSKEHDNLKVESFGMKFFDDIDETVKQIVNETYSYKTPISINLLDEKYTYSDLFSLLNQKDLNKAVKTEFEFFCNENHKNFNGLEYRNLLSQNLEDKDKVTSLYAYVDKSAVAGRLQILSGLKVNNISPLPITISNLLKNTGKENKVIVNIEKSTSITFIVNGKIYRVETIDEGMGQILDNIIKKENSYAKAYEICKNTTIYTSQGRNLQVEENEYMEDIMPALYRIIERLKEIMISEPVNVTELYITGLAAAINNIDLYFQENFIDKKCEVLVPFFVEKSNLKLNIRDYIEVNSAISLALQGLGIGYKEVNFKTKGALDQLSEIINIDIGGNPKKAKEKIKEKTKVKQKNSNTDNLNKVKKTFKMDFGGALDYIEINMIRFASALLILVLVYTVFTNILMNQIDKKSVEVQAYIADSKKQIESILENKRLINEKTEQYNEMIEKIDEANEKLTQSYAKKNVIPNFLTQIMFNIPKEVQLTSIQNTSGKTIKIEAQSKEYEQLGYFIAKIKNEAILTDVTSTSGIRQDDFIKVTIEGNLPY